MAPDPAERIESVRVGEIMIPLDRYPTVTPDTPIREAMRIMETTQLDVYGRKSLPRVLLVLDEDGGVRATVRRRDIMRGLEPKFLVSQPLNYRKKLFDVEVDPNLAQLSYDHIVKGIREQAEAPVRKIMRPIQVALNVDDFVIKALYEMVGYGLTLLPVMKADRVVGVVRTVELMHELSRIVLPEEELNADWD